MLGTDGDRHKEKIYIWNHRAPETCWQKLACISTWRPVQGISGHSQWRGWNAILFLGITLNKWWCLGRVFSIFSTHYCLVNHRPNLTKTAFHNSLLQNTKVVIRVKSRGTRFYQNCIWFCLSTFVSCHEFLLIFWLILIVRKKRLLLHPNKTHFYFKWTVYLTL